MKRSTLALAFLVASCGGSAPDTDASSRDSTGSGWSIKYTGDLSGEISGTAALVLRGGGSVKRATIAADSDGGQRFDGVLTIDVEETGTATFLSFSMTLADGTTCTQAARTLLDANVTNGDPKEYAVDFEGAVDCDGDAIMIDGFLRKG